MIDKYITLLFDKQKFS